MFEEMSQLVCAEPSSAEPAAAPYTPAPTTASSTADGGVPMPAASTPKAASVDLYNMAADFTQQMDSSGAGGAPASQGEFEGAGGTSGATAVSDPDPVQTILDRHLAPYQDLPVDKRLDAALFGGGAATPGLQPYRRQHDPNNQDTDLAAADHYLFARAIPNYVGAGISKGLGGFLGGGAVAQGIGNAVGGGAGAIAGLGMLPIVAGYDAYKAVGHGLKDHNLAAGAALGAAGMMFPPLAPLALGTLLGGDRVGDQMLKLIANKGETPSQATLKSVGWGMKGAAAGTVDNLSRMFGME